MIMSRLSQLAIYIVWCAYFVLSLSTPTIYYRDIEIESRVFLSFCHFSSHNSAELDKVLVLALVLVLVLALFLSMDAPCFITNESDWFVMTHHCGLYPFPRAVSLEWDPIKA
jgi:hypothetical protein